MRASGVLMPISSLPSKYGIGCFSKEAYEFVDFLISAGQKYWQILPLGPTTYGDSPYQSYSTFAGNPNYIDLEVLIRDGLLTEEEVSAMDWGDTQEYVDYVKVKKSREKVLRLAFERYDLGQDGEYGVFVRENGFWLEDYCLYMAIKEEQDGEQWSQWPEELRNRHPGALQENRERLEDTISFYRFRQYLFHKQWHWLKNYANQNGVKIIGDLPIYVAFDSADTWANPLLFQFDEKNEPVAVAGCPPDGFSADGQLWGNPLYSWEYHRTTEYRWWLQRLSYSLSLYDMVRIDHFRGFDEYYSIPYGDETAKYGHWEKGPGIELFHVIREKLGDVPLIAEDLGMISDSVRQLLRDTGLPGMKILQFAFDSSENSSYLPHNIERNCVIYTGTHDNDTVRGWYETANEHDLWQARQYMNNEDHDLEESIWDMIRLALSSVADLAIVPIQDYLCLGSEARINIPSTLGDNWKWRLKKGQISHEVVEKMRLLVRIYRR
ncbi:MAG: 4-alpha-glucanotransferase [Lachnospiraceae bacterium]|jgi:4-alpha-glucanotransferase|nr:4-alpha-glucanotransferase [Lachnospiraceae bacterium]